jgi:hypothetical protein
MAIQNPSKIKSFPNFIFWQNFTSKKKGWHPNMRNSYDEKELQLMSYPSIEENKVCTCSK